MKLRWLIGLICVIFGLSLLAFGLLVPVHLRALDAAMLHAAGRNSPTLIDAGETLVRSNHLGAAQLFLQAAQDEKISGLEKFRLVISNYSRRNPDGLFWGDDQRVKNIFKESFKQSDQNSPLTDFIIRQENRDAALSHLSDSKNDAVQELLRSRSLTKTVIFSPSQSAAGQAFDAAVAICGLLMDGGGLNSSLNNDVWNFVAQANRGGSSRSLEQVLMDLMSMGERFNWDQLKSLVAHISDAGTLHLLADEARNAGKNLPLLFVAVQLSGQPAGVANYLGKYPDTGLPDLGASLHYGVGGIGELLQQQQRFYDSPLEQRLAVFNPLNNFYYSTAKFSLQAPWLALAAKWLLFLLAGFFLAAALHFARPTVPPLELPLEVRGFHLFRESLFSLGFLFVVLLLSEPFLAQENQQGNFSLRLFPPMTGGAVPAEIIGIKHNIMNPIILLTLLVFFVLQALIYISCLVKLAEIRRQNVPSGMKLKLLENEDHLFDAGLYLGFVGTIISLIIASLGLVKFSLMAAYSSTSFGIIFVVVFKIFHLRPARRKLLLEAESQNPSGKTTIQTTEPTPAAVS